MALTKIGCVYSADQKVRRRTIHSDVDDSEVDAHKVIMLAGEAWLDISLADFKTFKEPADLDAHIASKIGAAKSDRCVVVDSNNKVVAAVKADPLIDKHWAGTIHQHDTAITGDDYTP